MRAVAKHFKLAGFMVGFDAENGRRQPNMLQCRYARVCCVEAQRSLRSRTIDIESTTSLDRAQVDRGVGADFRGTSEEMNAW